MTRSKYKYMLIFAGFCFSIAIKLYTSIHFSFWYDELCTIFYAKDLWMGSIFWDNSGALYYFIQKINLHFLGTTELCVRWPSVFFSIVTLFIMLKVGKIKSPLFATVLFLLTCVDSGNIYYGSEARSYALLELLSAINLLYFVGFLNETIKIKSLLISYFLLILCHPISIILIVAELIVIYRIKSISIAKSAHKLILLCLFIMAIIFALKIDYASLSHLNLLNYKDVILQPFLIVRNQLAYSALLTVVFFIVFVYMKYQKSPLGQVLLLNISIATFLSLILYKDLNLAKYFIFLNPLLIYLSCLMIFDLRLSRNAGYICLAMFVAINCADIVYFLSMDKSNLKEFRQIFDNSDNCLVTNGRQNFFKIYFTYAKLYDLNKLPEFSSDLSRCHKIIYFELHDSRLAYSRKNYDDFSEQMKKKNFILSRNQNTLEKKSIEIVDYSVFANLSGFQVE